MIYFCFFVFFVVAFDVFLVIDFGFVVGDVVSGCINWCPDVMRDKMDPMDAVDCFWNR